MMDHQLVDDAEKELIRNGKTTLNVMWIGGRDWWVTWQEFTREVLPSVYADPDYPFRVVGDGWWLELRHDRDYPDYWEYMTPPTARPARHYTDNVLDRVPL